MDIINVVLIASGIMVISATNAVHSVLWLVAAFLSGVVLFISLGAEYLGLVILVVYVGAIAVLFVFVVMMLDLREVGNGEDLSNYVPLGVMVGSVLLGAVGGWEGSKVGDVVGAWTGEGVPGIKGLGSVLYGAYGDLFILGSYILLVAMIGAIVLTSSPNGAIKRQEGFLQVIR